MIVGPTPNSCVFLGKKKYTETITRGNSHTGAHPVTMKVFSTVSKIAGNHQKLARDKESSSRAIREQGPDDTMIGWFSWFRRSVMSDSL